MRLLLKDFQDEYVGQLLDEIRAAQADAVRRSQAVTFSAPTGSGKTVMMAAAMERLIEGDAAAPAESRDHLPLDHRPTAVERANPTPSAQLFHNIRAAPN